MTHSPPCSLVHGIFQARTLEWVAMPSSRGSSQPRDLCLMSPALAGGFFVTSATNKVSLGHSTPFHLPTVSACIHATSAEQPYGPHNQKHLLSHLWRRSLPVPDLHLLFSFKLYFSFTIVLISSTEFLKMYISSFMHLNIMHI